jgi:hypothetical protein
MRLQLIVLARRVRIRNPLYSKASLLPRQDLEVTISRAFANFRNSVMVEMLKCQH